ncbi:hypothetical protein [Paracoccus aestuariivivens]|uniref:Uncharacterized protein n=1 Tax=Paracoccus aestuariivivens TaxID=1820333 RepID=A0A6L6J864_9RHOB|nr:hypothetical protein [Paracoccus aestuariivivens]MTH76344.1 hypothetical protein [Paracoccus aestuariivivens]
MAVIPPILNSSIAALTDWLELTAFFSPFSVARFDAMRGALIQQLNEPEDDIGERDRELDDLTNEIENEVIERTVGCGGGYPFRISDNGEELILIQNWQVEQYAPYLVCLLTSHLSRNTLLDFEIEVALVTRLRNRVFQVISVFAMAGLASGSAASVGWPREGQVSVLDTLRRAQERGAGFEVREQPGQHTPPHEKDGGIDVISWQILDRPPPPILYYGQVASGHDWENKPVRVHVDVFEPNYLSYPPRGNKAFVTLIPFRETEVSDWINDHARHGALLDRTRLPSRALIGMEIARGGQQMDESANMPQVIEWIANFRNAPLPVAAVA